MTRDGERLAAGLLYIHIDPKGSFMASGFYQPEPPVLQKIRARIVAKPKEIRAVVAGLEKAKLPFREDEPMKRTPRGFEAVQDEDLLALLRRKTLVVRRDVSRKTAADADALIAAIASFAKDAHPLLKFGWAALAG